MIEFDKTIIFQFINFLIILILLNYFLFKPVLNALKKRQNAIQSLSEKGEEGKIEAEGLNKTYDGNLKEKKLPIIEERDGVLKEAHGASMKLIEEARRDLTEELAKVKDAVNREAGKSLEALSTESDRLSSVIVNKLMKRSA